MTEILLAVILAAVLYLIIRFHVSLSKLVPGKAGDLLDDFKLNNSNAPVLTGDHVVQVTQAVGQAVAQAVAAVSIPAHVDPQNMSLAEKLIGRTAQTDAILDSRQGQSAPQANLDPGVIYYDHHTVVMAGSYKLEPTAGKTRLSLTYTSQDGKVAPAAAWANFGSGELGPMQAGVEASFDVPDGATSVSLRFDTDGRMIGQLFRVA